MEHATKLRKISGSLHAAVNPLGAADGPDQPLEALSESLFRLAQQFATAVTAATTDSPASADTPAPQIDAVAHPDPASNGSKHRLADLLTDLLASQNRLRSAVAAADPDDGGQAELTSEITNFQAAFFSFTTSIQVRCLAANMLM